MTIEAYVMKSVVGRILFNCSKLVLYYTGFIDCMKKLY